MSSLRRTLFVSAMVGLVAVGLAGAALYADPSGDQLDAPSFTGPDITSVEVTNTPGGLLTFRVSVTNYPPPSRGSFFGIFFDLDKNATTGDDGFEAQLISFLDTTAGRVILFRWQAGAFVRVESAAATAAYANGVVTLTVPRSDLFDTRGFAFGLVVVRAKDGPPLEVGGDLAPDEDADLWIYDLEGLGPPSPPTLEITTMGAIPARPRAGRAFRVRALVTRSDTQQLIESGKVTCTARIGSSNLKAFGRFRALGAECSIKVPSNAKAKQLRGTLTVRSIGSVIARRFTYRVS